MSTIAETPVESPQIPGLFRRAKDRFERAMLYTGGITDLGIQTVREIVRGPVETKLLIAQFEQNLRNDFARASHGLDFSRTLQMNHQ